MPSMFPLCAPLPPLEEEKQFGGRHFTEVCKNCVHLNRCISCSWFGGWRPRYFWLTKVHRYKMTKMPKRVHTGTKEHKRLEKERGVLYNYYEILEALRNHGRVAFVAPICSPKYGIRGIPDYVFMELKGDNLNIHLIEDKTHYYPGAWLQGAGYTLILADGGMLVNGKPFYSLISNDPLKINLDFTLHLIEKDKDLDKPFIRNGLFLEKTAFRFNVLKMRKKYLSLYKIRSLCQIDYCKYCRKSSSECDFWLRFCANCPSPSSQKQLTLGKFGVRRKSRPWTKERVLEEITMLEKRLGKSPSISDSVDLTGDYRLRNHAVELFGSWDQARAHT